MPYRGARARSEYYRITRSRPTGGVGRPVAAIRPQERGQWAVVARLGAPVRAACHARLARRVPFGAGHASVFPATGCSAGTSAR